MDETLDGWLAALASGNPTPGGGAASALLIGTGAALVEMTCNLTMGREKFRQVEDLMRHTAARVADLRAAADRLRDADAQAYDAVSAARALPRATPEEKEARATRIQAALHGATEVPLRTAEVGVEVLELAASIAEGVNPNVISDLGAAALAARAGAEAAALNVRINLAAIKDVAYVERQRTAIAALMVRAEAAALTTMSTVHAAIGG
ncbi:MAG TPA: cyclodeaminase/cyclohydrolase family protein [Chloroflexota bacterium]|nr:cyclodeaminase/cyclohydrolase family protein [Chloroflexota bacterium]